MPLRRRLLRFNCPLLLKRSLVNATLIPINRDSPQINEETSRKVELIPIRWFPSLFIASQTEPPEESFADLYVLLQSPPPSLFLGGSGSWHPLLRLRPKDDGRGGQNSISIAYSVGLPKKFFSGGPADGNDGHQSSTSSSRR